MTTPEHPVSQEMVLQPRLLPELEMEGEMVAGHLRSPVKDYGFKSYEGFKNSLKRSLLSDPSTPHVLVLMGEPKSGKSHILRDLAGEMKGVETLVVNWGDIVALAKLAGDIDLNKDYEDLNAKDVQKVTKRFENFLASLIDDYQGERVLIAAEVPALTGAYVREKFYGIDMGTSALWHLARNKGQFKNLAYKDYWAGVGARSKIRELGETEVVKLETTSSPEDVKQVLERTGNIIGELNPRKNKALANYAREAPNLIAVHKIAKAVEILIMKMAENGLLLPSGFLDRDRIQYDKDYRAEIVVQYLIKEILKGSIRPRRPRRSVFIADNAEELKRLRFNLDAPVTNIVLDLYSEIEAIKNKGNDDSSLYVYGERES